MRRSTSGLAVLVLLVGIGGATSACAQQHAAISSPKTAENPADFVGAEACALCHKDEVKGLDNDPHAKLALEHGGKGVTCESCHGPSKAHVESGGVASDIFQFTKATPKQVEKKCLACHIGEHPNFERTAHGQALISCTNCHSSHKFEAQTKMLSEGAKTLLSVPYGRQGRFCAALPPQGERRAIEVF